MPRYTSIYLHGRLISTDTDKRKRLIKEVAGLELMYQQGVMKQGVINRLKELAEKIK